MSKGGGSNSILIILIFVGIFIALAAIGNFSNTKRSPLFGNSDRPSPAVKPNIPTIVPPISAPIPNPVLSSTCGITVTAPSPNEQVSSTVNVSGYITGDCNWGPFEGQAGTVRVFDSRDNPLSSTEILSISGNWMQLPATFSTRLTIHTPPQRTPTGYLLFTNTDPSGESPRTFVVPIRF